MLVEDTGYKVCTFVAHPQEPDTFPFHIISHAPTALPSSILDELRSILSTKLGHQVSPCLPASDCDVKENVKAEVDIESKEVEFDNIQLELEEAKAEGDLTFLHDEQEYLTNIDSGDHIDSEIHQAEAEIIINHNSAGNDAGHNDKEETNTDGGEDVEEDGREDVQEDTRNDGREDTKTWDFHSGDGILDPQSQWHRQRQISSDDECKSDSCSTIHPPLKRQKMAYVLVPSLPMPSSGSRLCKVATTAPVVQTSRMHTVPIMDEVEWRNLPLSPSTEGPQAAFKYAFGIDLEKVNGTRKGGDHTGRRVFDIFSVRTTFMVV
ncbi:hypothetical protein OG21DRAFT_1481675 [Imleria badia]|nr:hypothetical protein OG21DRAFT_1481675 [Imleria badia]